MKQEGFEGSTVNDHSVSLGDLRVACIKGVVKYKQFVAKEHDGLLCFHRDGVLSCREHHWLAKTNQMPN